MANFPYQVARSVLTLATPIFPAAGDEVAPSRTPWKVADPSSEKMVRWVIEGCAAYPVTEDTAPERSVTDINQEGIAGLSAEPKHPISD